MELPSLYRSADTASSHGRILTRFLVGSELLGLVLASIAGSFVWIHEGDRFDLDFAAGVAFAGFGIATVAALARGVARPEKRWYEGRALAESVKSLSWLYAVGGTPFDREAPDADSRFITVVRDLLFQSAELGHKPGDPMEQNMTDEMRTMRLNSLESRQQCYLSERIVDQIAWYTRRSTQHRRGASTWGVIAIGAVVGGLLITALGFLGVSPWAWQGVAATVASSSIAWSQLNQHRTQQTSYSVTAEDLRLVRDAALSVRGELEWAQFVSDAEAAISREHIRWLARREATTLLTGGR